MANTQLMALKEAMMALLTLCKEHQTGSMYLYTEQGQGIIIHINSGDIIEIFLRNLRGLAAVNELKSVSRVKFFFKGSRTRNVERESKSKLNNQDVFKALGLDYSLVPDANLKKIMIANQTSGSISDNCS